MKTGTFLNEDELKDVKEKLAEAQLAGMTSTIFGPSHADTLWHELHKKIHALALSKGLPEIGGFYGLSNEGEFITIEE